MKKLIAVILCLVMAVSLAGCGKEEAPEDEKIETPADINVPSDDKNEEKEEPQKEDEPEFEIVDTKYYTVKIPESWAQNCVYEIREGEMENYTLSFYEKVSHEGEEGGHIFTIGLYPEGEDYTYYPSYEELGSLDVSGTGGFNIVITYPTDVQFSPEQGGLYTQLEKDVPEILESMEFKEDCVFSEEMYPIIMDELPPESDMLISKAFVGYWEDMFLGGLTPDDASSWNIEFRDDSTGTVWLTFEPGDTVYVNFTYVPYDTYLGENMDGIRIIIDSGNDMELMATYSWSNELQTTLMTLYAVQENGVPNLDLYRVFMYS